MHTAALVIFLVVFGLTALRKVGSLVLPLWAIMAAGAVAMVGTGSLSPGAALRAIDLHVMGFLLCMALVGALMQNSSLLDAAVERALPAVVSPLRLIMSLTFLIGAASAVLINDTIAIVGTSLSLAIARRYGLPPTPLLFVLAFAITTGSAASPIGNPQNLLIALAEMPSPFVTFARSLAVPTVLSLLLAALAVWLRWRGRLPRTLHASGPVCLPSGCHADRAAGASMAFIVAAIVAKVLLMQLQGIDLPLYAVAAAGAVPALCSSRRRMLVRSANWQVLAFFASLFVVMRGVWDTGVVQQLIGTAPPSGVAPILALSAAASQVLSNVPYVALVLPQYAGAPDAALLALAAGSTLAGNALLLGATSNVIITQQAEHAGASVPFGEFVRVGIPLTVAQLAVFALFLSL
jgi:Na+/H+ antiporter NhaD/arsenite permease-like protein